MRSESTPPRPEGRPPLPASRLAARIPGRVKPSIEVDAPTRRAIQASAASDGRSLAAQVRRLLDEGLALTSCGHAFPELASAPGRRVRLSVEVGRTEVEAIDRLAKRDARPGAWGRADAIRGLLSLALATRASTGA